METTTETGAVSGKPSSRLENRDFIIVLDKSGSMGANDTKSGKTRWEEAEETTIAVARKANQYDPDGITVYAFASSFKKYESTTPDTVQKIFNENEPNSSTVLAPVLADIFADHKNAKAQNKLKPNGTLVVVVTDGRPDDEAKVASQIVEFTKTMEVDGEFGMTFLQVGKDALAAAFLKKLDDDLQSQGAKFDIVDTKTMEDLENMTITEALIAALDD